MRKITWIILSVLSCTINIFASEVSAESIVETQTPGYTFSQIIEFGGWVMYVLGAISVFMLANVLYLFFTIRKNKTVPYALKRDVLDKIKDGNLNDARKLCEDKPSAFSNVSVVAIKTVKESPDIDMNTLTSIMEVEGSKMASQINDKTQWLLDIATISPMVGLFGTVLGMLKAFSAVGSGMAAAKPTFLAQGVSQALVTTIAGLAIAIPAMAFYAYFRRKASNQISHLETSTTEVATTILQK